MKKFIFLLSAMAASLLCISEPVFAALPIYSKTVYFGDSLTDMGNFTSTLPFNCDKFNAPETNQKGGTNPGDVWSNIQSAGFSATPSSGGGNDWAIVGAETSDLNGEIANYLKINGNIADPSTLYVVWVGSNDILFRSFNFIDPKQNIDPNQVLTEGMQNLGDGLSRLYNAGARNFLVIGVPDISETPITASHAELLYFIGVLNSRKDDLQKQCAAWNAALFETSGVNQANPTSLSPLTSLLAHHPDAQIFTWNPTQLLASAAANPSKYNYPDMINGKPNDEVIACTSKTNPDNYLFYNFIHPTSRSHTLLATNIRQCAVNFQECSAASTETNNVCLNNENCMANF